jgi:hypothetical protein
VRQFDQARIRGWLFDNHLLGKGAQRLTRTRHGDAEISATRIDVASFTLRRAG